ncbi:MAG: heme NO-binding protein [Bacteroidetes bacterium]|nr:MAG: heme NO-binding protein [Bacteroidota bacterium]
MYGIVNQAIKGLITENYGVETWEKVKAKGKVNTPFFLSDQPYDDDITYRLVGSCSEVLELSPEQVLFAFGEYWVLKTGQEKYGELMKSGGRDFRDFMKNLPNFHSRIMLVYPKLSPPEFKVEEFDQNTLLLHYYSGRHGLTHFVIGLIHGLAKMYDEKMELKHLSNEHNGHWHDLFEIKIN